MEIELECGIHYLLCTRIMWQDLPRPFGHWNNLFRRYQRWCLAPQGGRRSGDRAADWRALHLLSDFLVREELTPAREPCAAQGNEIMAFPLLLVHGHWRGPSWWENGMHCTMDMQCRDDDCRMRKGQASIVMGILRRAALNMVRTIQQNLETDGYIGLLRDRIGYQP
ncbi:MAG: transposase [Caldilineaceae bacterium SB0664_bin_22]|nr:transposase [Caldilineaceae bacterium SB0664_bin_22]